jgi:predicted transcriptional regulator
MLPPLFLLLVIAANPDLLSAVLKALRDALRHADVSQEKVAHAIHMNKGSLSRHLHREGGVTLARLSKFPESEKTIQWFAVGLLEQLGLPREMQRAARLAFGMVGKKRMAKAAHAAMPQKRSA